jgi:hypothetical protein
LELEGGKQDRSLILEESILKETKGNHPSALMLFVEAKKPQKLKKT